MTDNESDLEMSGETDKASPTTTTRDCAGVSSFILQTRDRILKRRTRPFVPPITLYPQQHCNNNDTIEEVSFPTNVTLKSSLNDKPKLVNVPHSSSMKLGRRKKIDCTPKPFNSILEELDKREVMNIIESMNYCLDNNKRAIILFPNVPCVSSNLIQAKVLDNKKLLLSYGGEEQKTNAFKPSCLFSDFWTANKNKFEAKFVDTLYILRRLKPVISDSTINHCGPVKPRDAHFEIELLVTGVDLSSKMTINQMKSIDINDDNDISLNGAGDVLLFDDIRYNFDYNLFNGLYASSFFAGNNFIIGVDEGEKAVYTMRSIVLTPL